MPGCALRVRSDMLLPITSGAANLSIAKDPALAGMVFHQQAALVDPGANSAGVVLSDAVTVLIC